MIICESLEYVELLASDVGRSCVNISIASLIDQYFTMGSVFEFLKAQWGIYTVILAYRWSRYGLLKVKI